MEPCAPRPYNVIRMLSAAESTGPAAVPTSPAGAARTCLRQRDIHEADQIGQSVGDRAPCAVPSLLGRLEQRDHGPAPVCGTASKQARGTEQAGDVHVVSARMH